MSGRRQGDPASLIAGVEKIKKVIGWEAKKGLREIIEDAHAWGKKMHEWVRQEQTEFQLEKLVSMFYATFNPFGFNEDKIRVFFAPGRINIIGEHTDYTKGYVLPAGIKQGVYILARKNVSKKIRLFGLSLDDTSMDRYQELDLNEIKFEKKNKWSDYVFASYFKLLQQIPEINQQGIDILVFGDLEQNSGLSSSAAIEMCSLVTLLGINGLSIPLAGSPEMAKLALLAQSAENNYIGVMSGIMDQFASGNAQQNQAILLNCKNLETKFVNLELEGYKFVLVNTNKPRKLVESKYNERVQECQKGLEFINQYRKEKGEKEVEFLGQMTLDLYTPELQEFIKLHDAIVYKRVSHVINENARVIQLFSLLSQKNQIQQIGALINSSGDSLKTLFEVTGEHLDILVETARKCNGVVGSRMVGAGFGGCTLNLIKDDKKVIEEFKKVVAEEYTKRTLIVPGFIEAEIGYGAKELQIK